MNREVFKNYVLLALSIAAITVFTSVIMVKQLAVNPTLVSKQLENLTVSNLLRTMSPLLNLVLNFRIFEVLYIAMFLNLLLIEKMREPFLRALVLTSPLVTTVVFAIYDVLTGNPIHTFSTTTYDVLEISVLFTLTLALLTLAYLVSIIYTYSALKTGLKHLIILFTLYIFLVINWRNPASTPDYILIYLGIVLAPVILITIYGLNKK